MTVYLDANGLVKLFAAEPGVEEVEALLRRDDCVITAANLAEAAYIASRDLDLPVEELRRRADRLIGGLVGIAPVSEDDAWRAAALRRRHYHSRRNPLSYADCLLMAAATPDDAIATSDAALAAAAGAEGLDVVELPDSRGPARSAR